VGGADLCGHSIEILRYWIHERILQPELIQKYGYPVEEHTVKTADGYLLTHFRIPHGRTGASAGRRRPVILQHGIASASDIWVLMGPERSLGNVSSAACGRIENVILTNNNSRHPMCSWGLFRLAPILPFHLRTLFTHPFLGLPNIPFQVLHVHIVECSKAVFTKNISSQKFCLLFWTLS
jgi:hypothetical protein